MTALEIKEKLKEKCKESWEDYKAYEHILGVNSMPTQKQLTEWITLIELYQELFGESLI